MVFAVWRAEVIPTVYPTSGVFLESVRRFVTAMLNAGCLKFVRTGFAKLDVEVIRCAGIRSRV